MKKIYGFILLLTINTSFPIQWLCAQSPTVNLYRPLTGNQLYEATQSITLSAGYTYDAAGENTFNARIVSANGQAYNYTESTTNSLLPVNTAYLVGSIAGSWSISPGGGATYSIPVEISPGVAGMVPNISINYNSQSGEGLMGLGWNVSGLSGITRVGSDLYHETFINNIQFNASDHYTLDGQRLIPVSSSEYRTESESFSKITAYGPADDPTYFIVESKDGKIIEYGNTTDSRVEAQGRTQALVWGVNKISDKSGNYMSFTYSENNATGEYYPLTINYTGNNSIATFNTIQFEFQPRTIPIVSYVSGSKVTLNSLIKNIYVKNEGTTVSRFQFLFNTNSRLTEIVQYGKNSTRLNSSFVNWGTPSTGLVETSAFTDPQLSGRYPGDFNGDGIQDFVIIKNSVWYLYLANTAGSFVLTSSGSFLNYSNDFSTGDLNGDGKDDLLVHILQNSKYYDDILLSTGNNFTQLGLNSNYYLQSDNPDFKLGDFDGDGMYEEMVKFPNYSFPTNNCIIKKFDNFTTNNYSSSVLASTRIEWPNTAWYVMIKEVQLDIDGNGKTDLMVLDVNGSSFYEYENGAIYKICSFNSANSPNINTVNLFGDFNGDGKTDIFSFNQYNNWNLSISKGNSFETPKSISLFSGWSPYISTNNYYARDMDGDMKSDLIVVGKGNNVNNPVKIYIAYSDGQDFNMQAYIPPTTLGVSPAYNNFGDFNGDGTIDYYYDNGSIGKIYTIYRGKKQNLISYITNGFGISSGVVYKALTDNTVYTKGTTSQYPIMDFQGPLYVVSALWAYVTPDALDITAYFYTNARIHRKGKGFLGFQQVTASDDLQNIKTIDQYEYNPTYFNVSLKQRNVNTASGSAISQIVNTNTLIAYGNKRILPYVSQSVENNYLGGITKTTSFSIDNNGNPYSIFETYDDGSYNNTYYTTYSSEGSWMPAKPQYTLIIKKHYSDTQSFSVSSTYTYQSGTGLVLSKVTGPLTTTYEYYTDNGNLKKVTQSDGTTNRISQFEYDAKGRFVNKSYNALNHLMQNTYDNATGNVLTETAPNGKVTTYTYDDLGRQTGISYPTGQSVIISYQWATSTRPTNALYYKLTTSAGLPTLKEYYDGLGRVLRIEKTGFNGTSIYSSTVYNTKGQVVQSSLPYYTGQQAMARAYTYDGYGRLSIDAGPGTIANYTYSGKTTQISTGSGQVSSKTVDSQGNVVSATDEGGTISYTYKSLGKTAQITTNGSSTSMLYDTYGRQTKLTDPDAGATTYGYNGYNELTSQTDAKNNTYSMTYDLLGRIYTRTGPEGITNYYYDPANNPGLLSSVSYSGGSETYTYDQYGRLTGKSKVITDGSTITYPESYGYDTQGRITSITYPSSFSVTNAYNSNGYLSEVRRTNGNALIWQGQSVDAFGHITQSQYGNNLTSNKTYNTIGLLTNIQTGSVQNLSYNFDPGTGNLLSRTDVQHSLAESFTYDNLNRLTNVAGPAPLTMAYNNAGNITSKTGIGNYTYGILPHAVTQVSNPQNTVSTADQSITYTPFGKVNSIIEGIANLQYTYDENRQRTIAKFYQNGTIQKTTHYLGNFEKGIFGSNTRQLHYIAGGDGLAAIYVINAGVDTMYYVHTDHLGSYDVITNQSGAVVQNYSFDAWGSRRNPSNWTYNNLPVHSLFSRGYTSHEHLDAFNLINMNGRVYDPLLGRFLSPDNYVQSPFNTQSYNRYSYCINNPLGHTDPSGDFFLGTIITFAGDFLKTVFLDGGISLSKNVRQRAWSGFDPSASWSPTNKAWKIDIGGFKTDPNRSPWGRAWQLISRWTWELPQTLVGKGFSHLRNMTGNVDNVDYYGGATLVNNNKAGKLPWGLTMGPYINSVNVEANPYIDETFRHEYGHTSQSRILGPIYLTQVGIPSFFGSFLDYNLHINNHNDEWYETQANRLSLRYFENHDLDALDPSKGGTLWNYDRVFGYPTTYKFNWYTIPSIIIGFIPIYLLL